MSSTPSQLLLRWYRAHGRKFPWRNTRDPYRILVSEIMLQQTQVDHVLHFYKNWLCLFPDWKTLARAKTPKLLHTWAGLGYNRRALQLREIAKQIVTSGIPKTEAEWMKLKGIGPYTAAAIALFANRQRTLPIDTNIRRVLGRAFLGQLFPTIKHDARIRKSAEHLLPKQGAFYDIPQALFDLAGSVCLKKPLCAACPLRLTCKVADRFLKGSVRIPSRVASRESRHRNKPFPNRIYRGKILKVIREQGSVPISALGSLMDAQFDSKQDSAWLRKLLSRLEKEQFILIKNKQIQIAL